MRGLVSCVVKALGLAIILLGLVYAVSALTAGADASIQVLMSVVAVGGGLVALFGLGLLGAGSLIGGKGRQGAAKPALSPEQQQLRDSRDFQAQSGEHG